MPMKYHQSYPLHGGGGAKILGYGQDLQSIIGVQPGAPGLEQQYIDDRRVPRSPERSPVAQPLPSHGVAAPGPQNFQEAGELWQRRLEHSQVAMANEHAGGAAMLASPGLENAASRLARRSRQHGIAEHAAEQANAAAMVAKMSVQAAGWGATRLQALADTAANSGAPEKAVNRRRAANTMLDLKGRFERVQKFSEGRTRQMVGIRKALAREIAPNAAALANMERVAEAKLTAMSTPPAPGNVTAALVEAMEQNGMQRRTEPQRPATAEIVRENAMAGYGSAAESPDNMSILVDNLGKASAALSQAVAAAGEGDAGAVEASLGVVQNHLDVAQSVQAGVGTPAGLEDAPGATKVNLWWEQSGNVEKAAVIGGAGLGILFILKSLVLRA